MSHDASAPPDWFMGFVAEVCGLYPSWKPTGATIAAYWRHLHDVPAELLARALAEHVAWSKFAPSVAELRACLVPPSKLAKTAAEAWTELRKNRSLYSQYATHVQNEERCKWSSRAAQRAAEAVNWIDPEWKVEQIPTIRAQFERYYNAIKDKSELIERKCAAAELTQNIGGMVGLNGLAQLYGRDYVDPIPDEPRASFEQRMDDLDPEWRDGAFPDGPDGDA